MHWINRCGESASDSPLCLIYAGHVVTRSVTVWKPRKPTKRAAYGITTAITPAQKSKVALRFQRCQQYAAPTKSDGTQSVAASAMQAPATNARLPARKAARVIGSA